MPHVAGGLEEADDDLEAALEEVLRRARVPHAELGIALEPETFLPFVASKIPQNTSVRETLQQLDIASLHLAFACARGDAAALAEIERSYLPKLDGALVRAGATGDRLVEVKQRLRERLFTSSAKRAASEQTVPDRPPRIADYGGRGDLGRWLRAVAVRIAIDLCSERGSAQGERDLDELALDADDPELAHMKERYRLDVAAAMRASFASLDPEARGDLRLYYLEGLRLQDLAALRRVAVSTMSRRLAAARTAVMDDTRRRLREELEIDKTELESILELVGSRLDLSRQWLDTKR
jgi:RNA polymerase sigma-70 factor (ECF subfamily)